MIGDARANAPSAAGMRTRFLVEVPRSSAGLADIRGLADRARRGAANATLEGTPVRLLRVVFIPEDGTCLLLYEAESEAAAESAVARAGIDAQRVARSLAPGDRSPASPA